MAELNFETLRARVQALGYKLIEDAWSEADQSERAAPGLYVLDPKTDTLVLTLPASTPRGEALDEIEDWIAGETEAASAPRFGPGHLDGIRLQAERVVRAYHELRADAKSSDFGNDDFPVGKFAELFTQIKQLDGWLEPLPKNAESGAETFSEYAERELSNIKKVLVEIDHLAHDGQESNDPTMTLAVIERLAADAQRASCTAISGTSSRQG